MDDRRILRLRIAALAILVVAAFFRFWTLEGRGVGHIEMYAPNIPLPPNISVPPPRLTLLSTFTGSLWEVHPPAWYLLNFPWTRIAGTSPFALRFPSAVLGVLSVWLVWQFARRERSDRTALIAAGLLSINGLHIMWSQIARPVLLVSTLGIASSLMLLRLASSEARKRDLAWYLGLTLFGLATDYYYWFLLAGQVFWVFQVSRDMPERGRSLLKWQFLAMAVASPLITLAVAQSRQSYLAGNVLRLAANYIGFGFPFPPEESSVPIATWPIALSVVLGVFLVVVSPGAKSREPDRLGIGAIPPPSTWLTWLVVIFTTLTIFPWAYILASAPMKSFRALAPTAIMPGAFLLAFRLTDAAPAWVRLGRPARLSTILFTVPPAIVLLLSLASPLVDHKYFLVFSPFLLVGIADGLARLQASLRGWPGRALLAALAAGILLVHLASLKFYSGIDATPIDFRGLAAKLRPELRPTDPIFVYKFYAMTPIYYHLGLPESRYVASDHGVRRPPDGRFWVISLRDSEVPDPKSLQDATAGCTVSRTLVARRIRAELYEHCGPRQLAAGRYAR